MRFEKRVKVIEGAERIFLEGSKRCVLLVHGYTGSPREMRYLAEGLNEAGWTVSVPRLPGHGTCSGDFSKTGARDWLRRAYDEYIDLSSRCEEIVVGGLSMGGIIATILGHLFDVEKLVLYAPAFYTSMQKYKPITYLLSPFIVKKRKRNWNPEYEDPTDEKLNEEYWRYDWFRQGREFFRLQAWGLRVLRGLDSKALVIVSERDFTVPLKVIDVIESRMKVKPEVLVLKESGHVVTNDVEREKVLKATLEWIEKEG